MPVQKPFLPSCSRTAVACSLAAGLLAAGPVLGSFQLSPQRIYLNETQRDAQVDIYSQSNEAEEYRVVLTDTEIEPAGDIELLDPVEPDAGEDRGHFGAEFLRYHPRQGVLEPNQRQTIRLMARIPDEVEEGEYMARLAVRTMPSGLDEEAFAPPEADDEEEAVRAGVETLFAMTIPISITVGDPDAEPKIETVRYRADDDGDDGELQVAVGREGDRGVYGALEVYRADGQEPVFERSRAVVVRALDERQFTFTSDNPPVEPGDEVRVVFRAFDEEEDEIPGETGGHIKAERTLTVE